MPTTYAHYRFGCDVLKNLPPELQALISAHRELFDFGVHGPDLLFYYMPYTRNRVNQLGYRSHERTGRDFFTQALKAVSAAADKDAALSYLLGVACHFALDRECHPYVAQKEKTGASHSEIESSFDRFLLLKDDLDALTHDVTQHLHPSFLSALTIADFYPPLSRQLVYQAEKSMKFYLKMLIAPPGNKRSAIVRGFPLLGQASTLDMLIPLQQNPRCIDSDEILYQHYLEAVDLAGILIHQLMKNRTCGTPLGSGFDHTFGEN